MKELTDKGVTSFCFKRVPEQYYQEDLEVRRSCLQAASIQHLCKSLVFENPRLPAEHEHQEFRHYLVLVQVTFTDYMIDSGLAACRQCMQD